MTVTINGSVWTYRAQPAPSGTVVNYRPPIVFVPRKTQLLAQLWKLLEGSQ